MRRRTVTAMFVPLVLMMLRTQVQANPEPCCHFTISGTPSNFVFKIRKVCWLDAGPPPDAGQVKLFRDGQELTDTRWGVVTTATDVTFTTPVPSSSADAVHKFEVVAGNVSDPNCRGQLTLGVRLEAGVPVDAQAPDQIEADRPLLQPAAPPTEKGCSAAPLTHAGSELVLILAACGFIAIRRIGHSARRM